MKNEEDLMTNLLCSFWALAMISSFIAACWTDTYRGSFIGTGVILLISGIMMFGRN